MCMCDAHVNKLLFIFLLLMSFVSIIYRTPLENVGDWGGKLSLLYSAHKRSAIDTASSCLWTTTQWEMNKK